MKIKYARKVNSNMTGLIEKRLPVKVAYAVQKTHKGIQEIIEFSAERQEDLIQTYSKKDENENPLPGKDAEGNVNENIVQIDEAKIQDFVKEMNELENTDIEVSIMYIDISDLDKCDEDKYDSLSPKDMEALSIMIKEE